MVTPKITKSICTYNTHAEEENSQKVHPCLDLNLLTIHLVVRDIKETTSKNAKNVKNWIQFSSQSLNSVSRTDYIVTDALSNEVECSKRKASPFYQDINIFCNS